MEDALLSIAAELLIGETLQNPWPFSLDFDALAAVFTNLNFVVISESHYCWLAGLTVQALFKFSLVTSVLVHIRVGALPIVLSESRYMTSVLQS